MTSADAPWLLKVEAVNFTSVLFDVDDLSAIRGGGEAMLAAPEFVLCGLATELAPKVTVEKLYSAASHVLARLTGTGLTEAEIGTALDKIVSTFTPNAAAKALDSAGAATNMLTHLLLHLVPQLSFAWGLMPESQGLAALETAVRLSQMRRLSVDVPPNWLNKVVKTDRPCTHDGLRARAVKGIMPDGKLYDLSFSVALRRSLGRTGRRAEFYARVLEEGAILPPVGYAHDFGELVEKPPEGVPEQIAGKIVHVSFDANSMGKLRDEFAKNADTATEFAKAILAKRVAFLGDLLGWAAAQDFMLLADPDRKEVDGKERTLPILRFEMLAWGADEMGFVLPAWALEPFLIKLADLLAADKWTLGDKVITHGIGLVIASHKAPIRLFKSLADSLADDCKTVSRGANMLQYWVAGSIDMPTRGLGHERAALFGVGESDDQSKAFTLPLADVAAGFKLLRTVKGVSGDKAIGVPRQKLMTLCREPEGLKDMLAKGGYGDGNGTVITKEDVLSDPFFAASASAGKEGMRFRHMLELWQYVELFP